jgi:beta-aspartyl-peptidase (threonine type)
VPLAIAVHGGAGPAPAPEREEALRAGVGAAARAGHAVLLAGGGALAAVETAVVALEDDPHFNAGRGSALSADGTVAMDAAIADGAGGAAGAVAAVRDIRNPVRAASALLADGRALLLAGDGASRFAEEQGLERRPPAWFVTDEARARLERTRAPAPAAPGTVGAVALDGAGRIAAATSTGGRPAKPPGRIGDSPLLGAGTWAAAETAAVSCTGDGEPIIRAALAHEVDALMRHAGLPLAVAAERALAGLARHGGTGGLIAIDAAGALALPFTTGAMSRAWIGPDGTALAAVGQEPATRAP